MSNEISQTLKELLTSLSHFQCVLHKHELLIYGGYQQRACYFRHTLKNEYKIICDVKLMVHCVVNTENNQITLLSFGELHKHTISDEICEFWSIFQFIKHDKFPIDNNIFFFIDLYQIQKMGKDKKWRKQINKIIKCCYFVSVGHAELVCESDIFSNGEVGETMQQNGV
ncbi:hypothetical protein RFI_26768 [Reticulomyxa filosa]|uniref:Uncharacterized protein n=1 Tax=Reticulomyxa filosa TaxID=46433 RepID=X6M9P3_RETFI|nr:hypothetical protein RFI_26768 [Reticulomyxa filosa]|eukprot:ETO10609.1 hypothetical protein RFI_26768 [Reticulomyxa filosa]